MPMMDVGVVGVYVRQHFVAVLVHMRLSAVPFEGVNVLVMFIVTMGVRVLKLLVAVLV
jgi:hypothetical protein